MQSSAYHTTGRPRARGLRVRSFNFSSSTVGDVKARVAATALSHAPGGFCHHPQALRTRACTEGRRKKSPCRFGDLLEPQRLDTSDPKHVSGTSRLDRSAKERVTAHLRLWERVGWSDRTRARRL